MRLPPARRFALGVVAGAAVLLLLPGCKRDEPLPDSLAIGQPAKLNNGLVATVFSLEKKTPEELDGLKPQEGQRWVMARLQVENTGKKEQPGPDIRVKCDAEAQGRRYTYEDEKAYDPTQPLAAKALGNGLVLLGVPEDCPGKRLTMNATGSVKGKLRVAAWPLP